MPAARREERHRRRRRQGRRRQDHRRRQPGPRAGRRWAAASASSTATSTARTCRSCSACRRSSSPTVRRSGRPRRYGLQVVSIGFMTKDDAPVIWRGPMLHSVDQAVLPRRGVARPGLPDHRHAAGHGRRGALAGADRPRRRLDRRHHSAAGVARRQPPRHPDVREAEHPGARRGREHELLRVPLVPPRSPTSSATAAASTMAEQMGVPFLGRLPIYEPIRVGSDVGIPLVIAEPQSSAAVAFAAVASQAAAQVSMRAIRRRSSTRGRSAHADPRGQQFTGRRVTALAACGKPPASPSLRARALARAAATRIASPRAGHPRQRIDRHHRQQEPDRGLEGQRRADVVGAARTR